MTTWPLIKIVSLFQAVTAFDQKQLFLLYYVQGVPKFLEWFLKEIKIYICTCITQD